MKQNFFDLEEDRLLDAWDLEFEAGIRNGPAYQSYNRYILNKKKKLEIKMA